MMPRGGGGSWAQQVMGVLGCMGGGVAVVAAAFWRTVVFSVWCKSPTTVDCWVAGRLLFSLHQEGRSHASHADVMCRGVMCRGVVWCGVVWCGLLMLWARCCAPCGPGKSFRRVRLQKYVECMAGTYAILCARPYSWLMCCSSAMHARCVHCLAQTGLEVHTV